MLGLRDVVVLAPSPSAAPLGVGVSIFPFLAANDGGSARSRKACGDCGNRAKRDCRFRRCRTCCNSRGYDCSTHFKSTWVPAAVRRDRQVTVAISGGSTSCANKRARISVSHASSYHQDEGLKETLPGEVNAKAEFKCIRVTSMNENKPEFAYRAIVTISGHVFKGLLYDHGVDHKIASSQLHAR